MERTSEGLTTRDTLLLITHAAGDEVRGRTAMQKLAYFSALDLGAAFGHRAYHYGPYSSRVEDAVENAVIAGELEQEIQRFRNSGRRPDVVRYTYRLSEAGQRRVGQLIFDHPEAWEAIRARIEAIRSVVRNFDPKTLSIIAKTYLLVREAEEEVEVAQIPQLAARLGWKLTETQARTTVELLQKLELVEGADEEPAAPKRGLPAPAG